MSRVKACPCHSRPLACAAMLLAIGATPSVAAKKGKKKGLGPVVT